MSYSQDLRSRVLEYVLSGGSKAEAARIYSVSKRTVFYWISRASKGIIDRKPGPVKNRKVYESKLKDLLFLKPDAKHSELSRHFNVHPTTIGKALKRLNITRKKNMVLRGEMLPKKKEVFEEVV